MPPSEVSSETLERETYLLPLESWMRWYDYHNAGFITVQMRDLGQEFASRFTINYERVQEAHFTELLKSDFIDVAGYAWPEPVHDIYPRIEGDPNHAWVLFRNKYFAF